MMKNPEKYNPALTPCLKSACAVWDNGECFSIRKSNNAKVNGGYQVRLMSDFSYLGVLITSLIPQFYRLFYCSGYSIHTIMSWNKPAGEKKKYSLVIGILFLIILITGCTSPGSQTTSNMLNLTTPTQPSTVVTTTVTTIITEVPQITSTAPLTAVQTPRAITSDDIKTHFMELAFGVETYRISKKIPYEISTGSASHSDKEVIQNFILEFNNLSKFDHISENIRDGTTGDLKIKFIPQEGMKDISGKEFNSNGITTAKIGLDTIYINNNLKGDQRNHTILRSLYFVCGIKGDTFAYPDSLFYYDDNNNTRLTLIDKKAVEIFYGAGVYNGMSVDDIKKVIYLK